MRESSADLARKDQLPTVNNTAKDTTLQERISVLLQKKEVDVPRRLQPRRSKGSRLMAAVASALACCSTAATPPTTSTPTRTTYITEPTHDCVACGSTPHEDCLHLGFCPECVFGSSASLGIENDTKKEVNIAEEEQRRVRTLKKGTKPLLTASRRTAIVTNGSGIIPNVVNQALKADLAKSATRTNPISSPNSTVLFEWCCNPDSKLSKKGIAKGETAVRCGLPSQNLSRPAVVNNLERR
jgi:hypothetical protein